MFTETVSYPVAFMAGLLSFFSPCVLPLIPAYFTFITGFSLDDLTEGSNRQTRKQVFLTTLLFVSGFSLIFILLGSSASLIGGFIAKHVKFIRIVGGILIIIFGIHLSGLFRIRGLEFEKRINIKKKPIGFFGSFLIGMTFAAGWTPCIGPLLGSILIIAGNQETIRQGVLLLSIYAAGLAIPFLIISVFINYMLEFIKRASNIMKYVNAAAGILLILVGAFLVSSRSLF